MTASIIIILCSLLLLAYVFDLTSIWTKIPSVILLLALGWTVHRIVDFFGLTLPDLSVALPVLGTLGLILIVLESSFDLKLYRSKVSMINKSFLGALLPMVMLAFILAFAFQYYGGYSFVNSLLNAIPFCIISSAVAIPSIRHLPHEQREFIVFESSLSDILGVLFFNFIALNVIFTIKSYAVFTFQVLLIFLVSLLSILLLTLLLNRVRHHVKFFPIIFLIVLIYAVFKEFHLPSLVFIMMFGLFLANLDKIKILDNSRFLDTAILEREITKFKELTAEATFVIRASFFLLFGFLIETHEILNTETAVWAVGIVCGIMIFRIIQLKISGYPMFPLLFVAPRGLISILLFLSIAPERSIQIVNKPMMIQVVILTALIMMFGLMMTKKRRDSNPVIEKEIQQE